MVELRNQHMSVEFSPSGSHDHISNEERARTEPINKVVLEAYYAQMCTDFRGAAFNLLQRNHAIPAGSNQGWAIFDLTASDSGSIAMADGRTDILVSISPRKDARQIDGQPVPDVYVMSNEEITGLNGKVSFLSTEFTLGHTNSAGYYLDVALEKNDGSGIVLNRGSLFLYDEATEKLRIYNRPPHYTAPSPAVKYEDKRVQPLGDRTCLEDKFYALSVGWGLLKQIEQLEPVYYCTGTS